MKVLLIVVYFMTRQTLAQNWFNKLGDVPYVTDTSPPRIKKIFRSKLFDAKQMIFVSDNTRNLIAFTLSRLDSSGVAVENRDIHEICSSPNSMMLII